MTACPTSQGICSDACTDALARYYKELFACISPNNNDANIEGLRAIYETRCQLVSAGQSCTQVAIANVHGINEKCANSDGFLIHSH
ncbi:MAG: hypothetical protein Q8P67_01495 [archaeon]|nr:hypothetical protein [archaeon]